jgi:hypothetical protein
MFKNYHLILLVLLSFQVQSKIEVKSTLPWMSSLAKTADCIVQSKKFKEEVCSIKSFDYSKKTGHQVIEDISNSRAFVVSTYKTKSPWSKAIATTYGKPKVVYFNTRKNPRDVPSMVNTLVHEWLHVLNYSHGDNSSKGKENSVNYKVGSIAEKYVQECL